MAQMQRVRVTRPYRHRGEDLGIGSVLDHDIATASELRLGKKAEFVAADTKVATFRPRKKEKGPTIEDQQRLNLELQQRQIEALTRVANSLSDVAQKLTAAAAPAPGGKSTEKPVDDKKAPEKTAADDKSGKK